MNGHFELSAMVIFIAIMSAFIVYTERFDFNVRNAAVAFGVFIAIVLAFFISNRLLFLCV